jgi:hypothetical protein
MAAETGEQRSDHGVEGIVTAGDGAEESQGLARTLLRIVLNDPGRLPENLAKFSHDVLAPRVPAYADRLRRQNPGHSSSELEDLVAKRGLRETASVGGFVGGPFIVLIPVAFVAALLAQIKMLLRIAAVDGRDPLAPERAAEVLVIMGVYQTTDQAAAAIRKLPEPDRGPVRKRSAVFILWGVVWRMARLLGLIPPAAANPVSWLVHLGRWLLLGLAFLVGTVAPLIWLPYLSMSYYRGTADLAERISSFYSGRANALRMQRKTSAIPGMLAAVLRAIGALVLIIGGVVTFLALHVRVAGNEWTAVVLLAIGTSAATGTVWFLRRRLQRHKEATS